MTSSPSPQHDSATSRSLLERVKAQEPAAWDRLVTLYAPLVLAWCRRSHLQDADAADVFQEVFQAVADHIVSFERQARQGTFRGWLKTITRNKINDRFRRAQREPRATGGSVALRCFAEIPAPEPSREADSHIARPEECSLYRRALELIQNDFEERTWRAFWRTAVDNQKPKDVGAELGMTPGAVRVAKSRVLQRLREELGDEQ